MNDKIEKKISIPKSRKKEVPEKFRFAEQGSLSWDRNRKEKYVSKLLETGTKTPFTPNKYNAPNREIMCWALALGLNEGNTHHSTSTSSTVPHNVFENSRYTFLLSRVAGILKHDDVKVVFDPNKIGTAVEDFANGGIIKLYEHCLGSKAGKDVEEGLIDLINNSLTDALEVLERITPPDETKE